MTPALRILLESSIRICAAAAFAGLALLAARVRVSSVKHAVWTGVLCGMLLMPALPYVMPPLTLSARETPLRIVIQGAGVPAEDLALEATPFETNAGAVVATRLAQIERVPVWPKVALSIYVCGALLMLARFGAGWVAMRRIVSNSGAALVGQATSAPVRESTLVAAPVTVGVISPKILLPLAWRDWPEQKLHAVLAHELAHVRRRDALTALLAYLNRCVFWFHPLAWWLERKLALTAEHAADDAGVQAAGESRRYAEVLLDMAEAVRRSGNRLVWQGVGADTPGFLGQRIERILRGGVFREMSRARKTALAFCCIGAVAIAAACRQRDFYTGALREDPEYAKQQAEQKAATDAAKAARNMSPQQAAELEAQVKKDPEDLEARKKLMLYYQEKLHPGQGGESVAGVRDSTAPAPVDAESLAAYRSHKLWFIDHHPEQEYANLVNPVADPEGDRQALRLWTAYIARPDASANGIAHAAGFFANYDKQLAERLILRAHTADPRDPWWAQRLGVLYASSIAFPETNVAFAEEVRGKLETSKEPNVLFQTAQSLIHQSRKPEIQALAKSYLERAKALDPALSSKADSVVRWSTVAFRTPAAADSTYGLAQQAERAYIGADMADYYKHDAAAAKAGWDNARKLAQQALDAAPKFRDDPDYGTALFRANMTLGMVAMRVDGDAKAAAKYLLAASKAPATEELAYYPPYFTQKLPVLLLKYGGLDGREAVIEFLETYGKIVKQSSYSLPSDAEKLRKGYMPIWYQYQSAQLK